MSSVSVIKEAISEGGETISEGGEAISDGGEATLVGMERDGAVGGVHEDFLLWTVVISLSLSSDEFGRFLF